MTTLYWGLEYAKVLICYLFILFIWPSVVFRKYLQGKSWTFRFAFCTVAPVILYTTAVIGLGLLRLLNAWVVNILFYGTFLFGIGKSLWPNTTRRKELRRLVTGGSKLRTFLTGLFADFRLWLRQMCNKIWQKVRPHAVEYVLLAVLVVYGVIYFSYAPFVEHSYGFGDMYVHHSWIYRMTQGQVFSSGVYPQGMHCVIYLMHTISGLSIYSVNLFLGCIQSAVFLLSAYCLMREIFRWRGTPLLVLTFFLVVGANVSLASNMARLQRTLPGEYGLYTVFLCALFLLRFLKEDLRKDWQKDWRAWLKNENLLMLSMALTVSIAVHFYITIIAFFICLPFAVTFIRRTLSRERFLPLAALVLCGVMIAALPMGLALLSGIPFQGSINWALRTMNGGATEAILSELESAEANNFFIYGYARLLGDTPGVLMILCSALVAVFWLIYRLVYMRSHPDAADPFDCYMPVIVASVILVIMYAAPYIGLPELLSYKRLPSVAYLLLLMVAAMPADILLGALLRFTPGWLRQAAPAVCAAAICAVTLATGHYHGYFFNELTRYRSVVDVTNSIVQSFPQNTYTVVSSTDDLYQVYEYGRHEELLDFLEGAAQTDGYYLPTEYVFVYVEKKPLEHAQYLYSSGPAWLATNRYADEYAQGMVSATRYLDEYRGNGVLWDMSLYPDILASEISDADAEKELPEFIRVYNAYRYLETRTIINSKAYKWCQDFAALYDHEMKVYYEDEDFVCYYFRQNPFSLYNLAIWD